MPKIVIADTTPLFYLHRVGCLDLLQKLYGQITVPRAVVEELREGGKQGEDVPQLPAHRSFSAGEFTDNC
jgi:predicted nucleic acid-binding protein